jgi:predicted PurR-regulated permease PerM
VFQRSVSVPGPLVILAAVCGGLLYGLLGALLAIPSMAALMLLYREVLIPELNRR